MAAAVASDGDRLDVGGGGVPAEGVAYPETCIGEDPDPLIWVVTSVLPPGDPSPPLRTSHRASNLGSCPVTPGGARPDDASRRPRIAPRDEAAGEDPAPLPPRVHPGDPQRPPLDGPGRGRPLPGEAGHRSCDPARPAEPVASAGGPRRAGRSLQGRWDRWAGGSSDSSCHTGRKPISATGCSSTSSGWPSVSTTGWRPAN